MMTDRKRILESAEEASKVVQDPELRKIAFQELVRNELQRAGGDQRERVVKIAKQKSTSNKSARAKSTIKRAVGIREEVKALDISPTEGGLNPWNTLSKDWQKFCWVLEAARAKKVDGLTSTEISYLIEHIFREGFVAATIFNLKKKIKDGFVRVINIQMGDRSFDGWKILSDGTKAVTKPAEVAETK